MIEIKFSDEEMKELNYQRYHHPHPGVQKKMEALWLKSQALPHRQIAALAGCCENTVTAYFKEYKEGGIERLKEVRFYRPQSESVKHTGTTESYFREHPPAAVREAMGKIEELTGIKRSETQAAEFIKNMGLSLRKVGTVPSRADPGQQQIFKEQEPEPRLNEAEQSKRKVFFADAAHFVSAPFPGCLWCFTRLFLKAPAGRKRFNVPGASDAVTHELITVTDDTYINTQSICTLLCQIAKQNLNVPVTSVSDNARYQKCKIVWEPAEALSIEPLYIPPYSPNLNIIERLWKFVKKHCLYSKYYSEFDSFKNAITNCLEQTHTTYKTEPDSLLTLKFQTFKKSQFMTF